MGSIVSRTRPTPLTRMNTATAAPMYPSSVNPVARSISAAIRTADVEITSFRLSSAVAMSVVDSILRPILRLNIAIHSLTAMDAASTPMLTQLKATAVGERIFSTLPLSSSTPMTRIITATISPEKYS